MVIERGRAIARRILPRGAILLAVLTFAAYLAGLVRDRIFARTYGAGPELDAYNAAFVLPELLLDVLVAAGLTAPFVPVFTTLRRDVPADAPAFAQTVLTLAVGVMGIASVVLFIVAPATVELIAPGFDEATSALYLDLFRLMLVTPILFAASITLGEILVAEQRFAWYALAPILYNLGIVAGTVLLHDSIGIYAAAVGAVLGASLHLGIRVVGMTRSTVRIRPRLRLRMPALHEFLRLMVPKMLAHPIEPLTFLFFTNVASALAAGSVTSLSFARNFQSVPVALVGVAISLAAFPSLSAVWASGERGAFGALVRTNVITITVLTVIAAVGLVIVGPFAIEVLLGGGEFDAEDVRVTASILAAFALAVPFDALGHLTARGLYATHNTLLAVIAAFAGFAVTVVTTLALVDTLDVIAIPLGFAAGMATKTVLQGIALAWRIRNAPIPVYVPEEPAGDEAA
ncbi:MAG TPA: murein biosynthesis integral membrane protein MurJ [Candidatus Limnocylindrales bacterium]|nr:murein biosynthesis integral membrane protein MurJ [Candidatus Limnocylindrales bacterium]